MMEEIKAELLNIIKSINIIDATSFSFAGKVCSVNPYANTASLNNQNITPLVALLKDVLYAQCYCRKFSGSYFENNSAQPFDLTFQATLSNANNSIDKLDKNWVIEQQLPNGQFVAKRNVHYKIVNAGEFITSGYQSAVPKEGTAISINCTKEGVDYQPAFYFVFGNEVSCEQNLINIVRFYFNIPSDRAASLINLVSIELNKYQIPFSFKCLNQPNLFIRNDASVLYITKQFYHITKDVLLNAFSKAAFSFNDNVPLFTKKLLRGVSIAEEPGNGESFGTSRCGMLAQAIITSTDEGAILPQHILESIQKHFLQKGINLYTAYLNNGSIDNY